MAHRAKHVQQICRKDGVEALEEAHRRVRVPRVVICEGNLWAKATSPEASLLRLGFIVYTA